MRFEQLEQFVALGERRHFRHAAEHTKISTSALTRSIQTLETELGYELVKRSTRCVKLTSAGEAFLDFAKNTLAELKRVKQRSISSLTPETEKKLIIGYTNKASRVVPVSCGEFLNLYPGIKIEMQLQSKNDLHRKLSQGEIDISVFSQIIKNIGSDIQLPDQLILFVSKNHPLANKHSISKKELQNYPMFSCFSESRPVQIMLNDVINAFNKASTIKVGSIDQVIAGLEKSEHFAIAGIEHAATIIQNSNLVQLKTNNDLNQEQLVVQTSQQIEAGEHVEHLLSLIKCSF